MILNRYGFGLDWLNQGVEDCSLFLKEIRIYINMQESSYSLYYNIYTQLY